MKKAKLPFVISLILYAISLVLPAMGDGPNPPAHGYQCLLLLPIVCIYLCWWANPLWIIACVFVAKGRIRRARFFAVFAFLVSLTYFLLVPFRDVRYGSFVWMTGLFALWVATAVGQERAGEPVAAVPPPARG